MSSGRPPPAARAHRAACGRIFERELSSRLEHLIQPRDALELRARCLEHERRRVAFRLHVVIRRGDKTACRVQFRGKVLAKSPAIRRPRFPHRQSPGPSLDGVRAEARHEMLPSTSPQIRFSDGAFQVIASRNVLRRAPARAAGPRDKVRCRVRAMPIVRRRRGSARGPRGRWARGG